MAAIVFFFYLSLIITSLFFLRKLLFLLLSNRNKDNHSLPPSPGPSLPFLGHLHLIKKPLHRAIARLSARHGPLLLLRFGSRRVLLVSSHSLAEECFTKNDLALASRPQLPSSGLLTYNYTTLAAAPYGPHWRNLRRIASVELLSSARLHSLREVRRGELRALVSSLFRECHGSAAEGFKKLEVKSRVFGLALNVIMRMIAGKRYYYVEEEEDSGEARRFRGFVEEVLSVVGVSNTSDFLPAGLSWMGFRGARANGRRIERLAAVREEILQGLIEEERRRSSGGGGDTEEGEKKKKTMIQVLLSLQEEDPDYYTDDIIKAQMQTLLVAGSDTTTETIEWAMSRMANHPGVLRKARSEIDACVGSSRLLEEHDLPNLPYLHGIISETSRLHPTAPLLVPHESQEECTVGGYRVPCGTILLVNAWAIQRDPEAWEEPLEFRPERFMDGRTNKGELGGRLIPFGMGRRKCPGEGLATRVVGLVLGTMIQCFEWERIGEEEVDMAEKAAGVTLPKATALELMYRPRQAMMSVLSQL